MLRFDKPVEVGAVGSSHLIDGLLAEVVHVDTAGRVGIRSPPQPTGPGNVVVVVTRRVPERHQDYVELRVAMAKCRVARRRAPDGTSDLLNQDGSKRAGYGCEVLQRRLDQTVLDFRQQVGLPVAA